MSPTKYFGNGGNNWFIEVIMWVAVLIAPVLSIMATIVGLLLADFITAIWATVKINGWRSVSAKRMFDSIPKLILYNLALLTTFFVQHYIIDGIPMIKVIGGFIALIELRSIYENIRLVTNVDLWNSIKDIVNVKSLRKNDS